MSEVNEQAELQTLVTHAVFKHEDLQKLSAAEQRELANLAHAYRKVRENAGKDSMPSYIVINRDEDPRMIKKIVEVMKEFGKWGE